MLPRRALAALAVAVLALAACDDKPGAEGTVTPAADYEARVLSVCAESLGRVDCDCFWNKSKPAFTKANVNGILATLVERDTYGPAITRARLEQTAGQDGARTIGRALFDCAKR